VRCTADDIDVETEKIKQYGLLNNLSYEYIKDNVFIDIIEKGTVDTMSRSSMVLLQYRAEYTDGVVFDRQFENSPTSITLSSAIQGLQTGLPFFGKGGRGTIIVPSGNGFGNNPPRGVRKNAILIFHVNVINF
jgi:FKBP-type peptidyl-prolyl cis-trans isomerase FkpA